MQALTENIVRIFGEQGLRWLETLPTIVSYLTSKWQLEQLNPVNNLTYNYVATAKQGQQDVVLKIACDSKAINEEKFALNYFAGHGAVKLLDSDAHYHALLLEQAIPGNTLKSLYRLKMHEAIKHYVDTANTLHNKCLPPHFSYRHVRDWLTCFDTAANYQHLPQILFNNIKQLKNSLLASTQQAIFLHGDLHHDNIIAHGETWLAIDPQGIIGEAAFDYAAFDFMYVEDLAKSINVKEIFLQRLHLLAHQAAIDPIRLHQWVLVRLMLMAIWLLEDNGDAQWAIQLASALY